MDYAGLGVIGAVIASLNGVYYFWTILKGHTKPHRISWFGWALVGTLGTWSAFSGGAGAGGYVVAVETVEVFLIFLLSLLPKYGKPGGRKFDYLITIAAILTIVLWQIVHFSPAIAAAVAVIADLWFSWLTIRECWYQPETEAVSSWFISIISAAFGVAALQSFSFAASAFPIYVLVVPAITTAVLLARRADLDKKPHDQHPPIL